MLQQSARGTAGGPGYINLLGGGYINLPGGNSRRARGYTNPPRGTARGPGTPIGYGYSNASARGTAGGPGFGGVHQSSRGTAATQPAVYCGRPGNATSLQTANVTNLLSNTGPTTLLSNGAVTHYLLRHPPARGTAGGRGYTRRVGVQQPTRGTAGGPGKETPGTTIRLQGVQQEA